MKTVKIYFSEEDMQDMQSTFYTETGDLWNTWSAQVEGSKDEVIKVELYLGNEDDIENNNKH